MVAETRLGLGLVSCCLGISVVLDSPRTKRHTTSLEVRCVYVVLLYVPCKEISRGANVFIF